MSEYDLSSGEWFVLLSLGGMEGDLEQYHGSSASGVAISSPRSVQFGENRRSEVFSGASLATAGIRTHAFLMFFAWGFLVPAG